MRIIKLYGDEGQCYGRREKLALLTKQSFYELSGNDRTGHCVPQDTEAKRPFRRIQTDSSDQRLLIY